MLGGEGDEAAGVGRGQGRGLGSLQGQSRGEGLVPGFLPHVPTTQPWLLLNLREKKRRNGLGNKSLKSPLLTKFDPRKLWQLRALEGLHSETPVFAGRDFARPQLLSRWKFSEAPSSNEASQAHQTDPGKHKLAHRFREQASLEEF